MRESFSKLPLINKKQTQNKMIHGINNNIIKKPMFSSNYKIKNNRSANKLESNNTDYNN